MVVALAFSLSLNVFLSVVVILMFSDKKKPPKHRMPKELMLLTPQDDEWVKYINSRAAAIRDHGFSFFEVHQGDLHYVNS